MKQKHKDLFEVKVLQEYASMYCILSVLIWIGYEFSPDLLDDHPLPPSKLLMPYTRVHKDLSGERSCLFRPCTAPDMPAQFGNHGLVTSDVVETSLNV